MIMFLIILGLLTFIAFKFLAGITLGIVLGIIGTIVIAIIVYIIYILLCLSQFR